MALEARMTVRAMRKNNEVTSAEGLFRKSHFAVHYERGNQRDQ